MDEVYSIRCRNCGLVDQYEADETHCHRCGRRLTRRRALAVIGWIVFGLVVLLIIGYVVILLVMNSIESG